MNSIVGIGEDGFPIFGADFSLQPKLRIGKLTVLGRAQKQAFAFRYRYLFQPREKSPL